MQELLARDVFVRKPMAPVLDRTVRISVGPEAEIDLFEAEFGPALEAARQAS
jgi:histidinol-phosphate aminotransferase